MSIKILINAVDTEECRIAKVSNNRLEEFHIETTAREVTQGNIYKAVVSRVEPSLQAVFVDYGVEKNGFLQKHEIHPDYFLDDPTGSQSLKTIIKTGQELMVQVTKEPFMKKGAMLTTFVSIPGRHTVLMPGSKNVGVSRKIEDDVERKRIKEMMGAMLPEGFGIIVRTAGRQCTKTTLSKEFRTLMRVWKTIIKGVNDSAPVLLHKERTLAQRVIRDYFTPDISEILIDDETVYKEIIEFIKLISPQHQKIVKRYKTDKPIFSKHQLEDQIASIFENRVSLTSGGSIVIEQTEALVAIDVNSGKATQKKNVEETALQTNLEAAEEVARQLRLRDFGGLIVIDFIDMRDRKNRAKIEKAIKAELKSDKARTKVGRLSVFGLLEMSRQRIRPSIQFINSQPCRYCRGKGVIPTVESLGLNFLRRMRLETLKDGVSGIKGYVPKEVAAYLLNRKKKELLELELQRDVTITIEEDLSMIPGEGQIVRE
ncbi:MAG: Rne/Rng family ribonuclease [Desulfobacteraceae bacterium]|jgi:ribonuclease E|nr:Rne/Rng family ribonuclease [Desulfobacteraceae bacterium]